MMGPTVGTKYNGRKVMGNSPSLRDVTSPQVEILRSNLTKIKAIVRSIRSTSASVDDRVIVRHIFDKFPKQMITVADS
jgi:hypothetical protein